MQPRLVRPAAVAKVFVAAVAALTLLGSALVAAGVGGVRLGSQGLVPASSSGPTPRTGVATGPDAASGTPGGDSVQVDALDRLLRARSAAVLAGDRAAWLRTVDPTDAAFRGRQSTVFGNLADVPFASWSYQFLGRAPTPARWQKRGADVWVAHVLAEYMLQGYDLKPASTEQFLTLVRRSGRWYVGADTDGPTSAQPWDLGRVSVVRGQRVLALGTAPRADLERYVRSAEVAVRQVSSVWGKDWTRRAVLLVPRTQSEFGRLLQRNRDGLDQVAAVTTGDLSLGAADGSGQPHGRAGNDRVVLNPTAFARLAAVGRQVVLTHELSHVAVRQSTDAGVPTWLSEGFADYIAYRASGVSRQVGAADLLAQVRASRGPRTLPDDDAFDPTRTTIAPSYSAAWLACALIADRYGTDRLVSFYRRAAAGIAPEVRSDPSGQVEDAFERVLGVSQTRFTAQWLRYLDELAGR